MAYTEVFQTLKLEVGLTAVFGILLGMVIGRKS
jgi:hypothetical protein